MEYLEDSAKNDINKTAVADETESLTYGGLMQNAKAIGSFLCQEKVSATPIPVFMEKGVKALQAFFGILYAGCFYVLINPELPKARIDAMLNVLGADIVVTSHSEKEKADNLAVNKVLFVEDLITTTVSTKQLDKIRSSLTDTLPLYANFTSGSTGTPKCVVVNHRSAIDFIDEFTKIFDITSADIIGNQAPFDFDVSVKDIYSAMKAGATLQIIPKKLFSAPAKLMDYLCERKITTLIWAVSALCLITTFHALDYRLPIDVKKVMFSGEIMPVKHLRLWMSKLPSAEYVNLYGPTEITCNCTYHKITKMPESTEQIPIGRAFPNEKVFLLDDDDNEVTEFGKPGEICVSGSAVTMGYYNNPQETAKHFVQNPMNDKYIEIIYKTGDMACYKKDGNLYFSGRKDFQIKYQGHRIELEEIEAAIGKVENVDRVCCIYGEKKKRLAAFYVGAASQHEIKESLQKTLPVYMQPNAFVQLEFMPMTKNGKTDRNKLKLMIGED